MEGTKPSDFQQSLLKQDEEAVLYRWTVAFTAINRSRVAWSYNDLEPILELLLLLASLLKAITTTI